MTQLESKLIMKLAQVESEKIILKDKIKRAIEYIKDNDLYEGSFKNYITPLLAILGDKENE